VTRSDAVRAAMAAGATRGRFWGSCEAVDLAYFLGARPWDRTDDGWEYRPGPSDHDTRVGAIHCADSGPYVSVYPVY
jgi:hypothetical protein